MKKFLPILVALCLSGCLSKKNAVKNSDETAVKTMEVVEVDSFDSKELA